MFSTAPKCVKKVSLILPKGDTNTKLKVNFRYCNGKSRDGDVSLGWVRLGQMAQSRVNFLYQFVCDFSRRNVSSRSKSKKNILMCTRLDIFKTISLSSIMNLSNSKIHVKNEKFNASVSCLLSIFSNEVQAFKLSMSQ